MTQSKMYQRQRFPPEIIQYAVWLRRIPLKYAHGHGGALWSPLLKKVFANDPDNILVTEDNANQTKGPRGPSEYMPPRREYHCEYIRRWRFLLSKYELEAAAADLRVLTS